MRRPHVAQAQPFLQLVHVSDMHVFADRSPTVRQTRSRLIALAHTLNSLAGTLGGPAATPLREVAETILEGIETHDASGARRLDDFIASQVVPAVPRTTPTLLVVSGDQTTFGDAASIAHARSVLAKALAASDRSLEIHGNHDAWLDRFPLFAPRGLRVGSARRLTQHGFLVEQISGPHAASGAAGLPVELYTIDTVDRSRAHNTLALGFVSDAQLDELERAIDQRGAPDAIRVLVSHHPIAYPPPLPARGMVVRNGTTVAARLAGSTPGGGRPVVHMILSGHTHVTFPGHGQLTAPPASQPQLGPNQAQLVVGTATQRDTFGGRGSSPYQFQVLRFAHGSPHNGRRTVVVERRLVVRGKIGPFRFLSPSPGASSEALVLSV